MFTFRALVSGNYLCRQFGFEWSRAVGIIFIKIRIRTALGHRRIFYWRFELEWLKSTENILTKLLAIKHHKY